MKRVLLPTDFSDNALDAVDYAIRMFSYEGVHYILLNTYSEPDESADILISIGDILERESKRKLENELDRLYSQFPKDLISLEARSVKGKLVQMINALNKSEAIDYIVMGAKGISGLKSNLTGSNTIDIITHIKCPILVVPEKVKYAPPSRIAFVFSDELTVGQDTIVQLKALVDQNNSDLFVVNVKSENNSTSTDQQPIIEKLDQTLSLVSYNFRQIDNKEVVEGMSRFISKNAIDMVVMGGHQRKFIDEILRSESSHKISGFSQVPLLVLR